MSRLIYCSDDIAILENCAIIASREGDFVKAQELFNQANTKRVNQAILDISAGAGEPTHTDTSDAGSWRYLGTAIAPQKGIAAFNQEDFDVTAWDAGNSIEGGFVTIAAAGVDNTHLQNNPELKVHYLHHLF